MTKHLFLRIAVIGVIVSLVLMSTTWKGYAEQSVPVFMYHSITENLADQYCLSPKQFDSQMNTLKSEGYSTLTAADLLHDWRYNQPLPAKAVVLTFDDGYEDNYLQAFPTLKKYHAKATIFLATGLIGKKNYLSWREIQEMQKSGIIDFESHTVHHPNLLKLTAKQQLDEFIQSKQAIEAHLHSHVEIFAYPFGYHNRGMITKLKNTGYKMAFDSDHGYARYSQGMFTLHRIEVTKNESIANLLASK